MTWVTPLRTAAEPGLPRAAWTRLVYRSCTDRDARPTLLLRRAAEFIRVAAVLQLVYGVCRGVHVPRPRVGEG